MNMALAFKIGRAYALGVIYGRKIREMARDNVTDANGQEHDAKGLFTGKGGGSSVKQDTNKPRRINQKAIRKIYSRYSSRIDNGENPYSVLSQAASEVKGFTDNKDGTRINVDNRFVRESGAVIGRCKGDKALEKQMAKKLLITYSDFENILRNGNFVDNWHQSINSKQRHPDWEFRTIVHTVENYGQKFRVIIDVARDKTGNAHAYHVNPHGSNSHEMRVRALRAKGAAFDEEPTDNAFVMFVRIES